MTPPDASNAEPEDDSDPGEARSGRLFPTTQWSTVLKTRGDEAGVEEAMNDLCSRYWHPIYGYLRGRGFERTEAQDITQNFFLKAVTDGLFQNADEEKGKLRSFLLGALTRHLSQHLRKERAVKRGGRAIVMPIECEDSEQRYLSGLIDRRDPEKIYLAAWARELVNRALSRLRAHYEKTRRGEVFAALESVMLMDDEATPYRDLATRLDLSEAALRLQVFRSRQRFGRILREEVAQTVRTPEELQEELAWLLRVLQEGGWC